MHSPIFNPFWSLCKVDDAATHKKRKNQTPPFSRIFPFHPLNFYTMRIFQVSLLFTFFSTTLFGQWSQSDNFIGIGRNHPVVFTIGDSAYAATGYNTLGQELLADFYRYEPQTSSWTQLADFPGGERGFAVGASHAGKGYLGFGLGDNIYKNDLWEFDPATQSWTELTPCPCLGRRHPAFAISENGKILVGLGDGDDENGEFDSGFKDWWEYDISTDAWIQRDDLPAGGRHHPYYFALGNQIYAGFGHNGNTIYNDFFRYDVPNASWTQLNDFPGEARVAGAHFTYEGYGYIVDGEGSDHRNLESGEFFRYNHSSDTWETLPFHDGDGLWAPSAFVYKDTAFVFGGDDNSNISATGFWKYNFGGGIGVGEVSDFSTVKVYPNPVREKFSISGLGTTIVKYEIRELSGRLIRKGKWYGQHTGINVEGLIPGYYQVQVELDGGLKKNCSFLKN